MKIINLIAVAALFATPALHASGGETQAGKAQSAPSTITPIQRVGHCALGVGKLVIAASWIAAILYLHYTIDKKTESALENYTYTPAGIPLIGLNLLGMFCTLWGSKSAYHSAVESFKKARA